MMCSSRRAACGAVRSAALLCQGAQPARARACLHRQRPPWTRTPPPRRAGCLDPLGEGYKRASLLCCDADSSCCARTLPAQLRRRPAPLKTQHRARGGRLCACTRTAARCRDRRRRPARRHCSARRRMTARRARGARGEVPPGAGRPPRHTPACAPRRSAPQAEPSGSRLLAAAPLPPRRRRVLRARFVQGGDCACGALLGVVEAGRCQAGRPPSAAQLRWGRVGLRADPARCAGSFAEYLRAELNPATSAQQASADLLRGQNERQRVCALAPPAPCSALWGHACAWAGHCAGSPWQTWPACRGRNARSPPLHEAGRPTARPPAPRRHNALLSVPYPNPNL